jgi:hypothetical protein
MTKEILISTSNEYSTKNQSFKLAVTIVNNGDQSAVSVLYRVAAVIFVSVLTLFLTINSKKQEIQ